MLVQASVGLCVGERPFQWSVQQGRGRGRGGICHMDEKDKGRNGRDERRKEKKGETQRPMSTHLTLPTGPGDADGTVLLIHTPSSTSSPVFCSRLLFLLPLCCFLCDTPQSSRPLA